MQQGQLRLGIDIGGTFTDFVLYQPETNELQSFKVRTTKNPADGIIEGLTKLEADGFTLQNVDYFVHGMTIGLNTLLQRRGTRLALFVTEGFRDILTLQRLRLPIPYNFYSKLPKPLIERKNVFPIKERTLFDGTEKVPVDYKTVDRALAAVKNRNLEGIVVAFLHSYVNPEHEQNVKKYIQQNSVDLEVVSSSDINPQIREYERTLTAIINSYIKKSVKVYLQSLDSRIKSKGVRTNPLVTQSNGGIMGLNSAIERPVNTLFSGPASGILGASKIAQTENDKNIITIDVGGTSADISIIKDNAITLTQQNQIMGFPISVPSVSLYSIGAGGGSYAWIDKGGMLKVGPDSAGSYPGPAAYGIGDKMTLTDAFLLCNYLNPSNFAGGSMSLDKSASEKAARPFADYLNTSAQEAADNIIQVVTANMVTELNNIIEQRGFDPNDFSLIAYGGAGPLMAGFLAEEIGFRNIIVPRHPGTLCALGALSADYTYNGVTSYFTNLNDLDERIINVIERITDEAYKWMEHQDRKKIKRIILKYFVDARYRGQSFELKVPVEREWFSDHELKTKIHHSFNALYLDKYKHNDEERDIEITNVRITLIGETFKPTMKKYTECLNKVATPSSRRNILIRGHEYQANVYRRENLCVGNRINGPAIIDQNDTTTLILNDWYCTVDQYMNLNAKRNDEKNGH